MKRLGVFCFYDEDGKVDRYVDYLLKDMADNLDALIVVCNGIVDASGRKILTKYSENIIYRENIGLDAAAFKMVVTEKLPLDYMATFDEMVFFNSTFYGPFYPLKDMFSTMEEKSCDFWGVTKHFATDVLPEHVQTYFYAVRRAMFLDSSFRTFWEEQDDSISIFAEAVTGYELRFTQFFKEKGFNYVTYLDLDDYKCKEPKGNFNLYEWLSYELIKYLKFPFLKKKNMIFSNSGNTSKALEYIAENLEYDIGMIWENALRQFGIAEINKAMGMKCFIDGDARLKQNANEHKWCGCAIVYLENFFWNAYLDKVFADVANRIDVYAIVTDSINSNIVEKLITNNVRVVLKENWSIAKTVEYAAEKAEQYDYLCVINDSAFYAEGFKPTYMIVNDYYRLFGNLLCSAEYVDNVISLFERTPYLGTLFLPYEVSDTFECSRDKYDSCVENIKNKYKINIKYERQQLHSVPAGSFWCRASVLSGMEENRISDVMLDDISSRVMIQYMTQDRDYYCASVFNSKNVSDNISELETFAEKCIYSIKGVNAKITDSSRISIPRIRNNLRVYCENYDKVYIYGTGLWGELCYREVEDEHISNTVGFIVSDGHFKRDEFHGIPVLYLSQIDIDEDTGIIVALDDKYASEVIPMLEAKGLKNYLKYAN